jgi:hypothetical protein
MGKKRIVENRRAHQIKAILMQLFFTIKFQTACKRAATRTIESAVPVMTLAVPAGEL